MNAANSARPVSGVESAGQNDFETSVCKIARHANRTSGNYEYRVGLYDDSAELLSTPTIDVEYRVETGVSVR